MYLLLMPIFLSACSGIRVYTFYHPDKKDTWINKKSDYYYDGISYSCRLNNIQNTSHVIWDNDTLSVTTIPGSEGLWFAPVPVVPFVPVFLLADVSDKLVISLSFLSGKREINIASMHYIVNNGKEIFPVKVLPNDNENKILNECKIYFDEKLKDIKKIEIRFENIDNSLYLKRKRKYDYHPLLIYNL